MRARLSTARKHCWPPPFCDQTSRSRAQLRSPARYWCRSQKAPRRHQSPGVWQQLIFAQPLGAEVAQGRGNNRQTPMKPGLFCAPAEMTKSWAVKFSGHPISTIWLRSTKATTEKLNLSNKPRTLEVDHFDPQPSHSEKLLPNHLHHPLPVPPTATAS